jgi:hypothetical protein
MLNMHSILWFSLNCDAVWLILRATHLDEIYMYFWSLQTDFNKIQGKYNLQHHTPQKHTVILTETRALICWVTMVVVVGVTAFTMVTRDTLCSAVTLPSIWVALWTLIIALTCCKRTLALHPHLQHMLTSLHNLQFSGK